VRREQTEEYDVIVIGGGAAGLSAAVVLGRARRRVLLCDAGAQRNSCAEKMHGFLSRDGESPGELLKICKEQLAQYPSVGFEASVVQAVEKSSSGFRVELTSGTAPVADLLLLATGMADALPEIDGLREAWGRSAFVCPYCDGWEIQDRPIAVSGGGVRSAIDLAQELYGWTRKITVCGHTESLSTAQTTWLHASGVRVDAHPIRRIVHDNGHVRSVQLEGGDCIDCDAVFFSVPLKQGSDIAERLGCKMNGARIEADDCNRTSVPGCFAAGDNVTHVHQVIVAAASGVRAAIAINDELVCRDVRQLV